MRVKSSKTVIFPRKKRRIQRVADGWSFAADDTLMADIRVTAGAGGRVRFRDGEAARTLLRTVNADGLETGAISAVPRMGLTIRSTGAPPRR